MKQHKFVIADYKRCIGCATCMAACFRSACWRGKLSKLDCGAPSSKRRHNGAASPVR